MSGRKAVSNTFYLFLNWFSITVLGYAFWYILANFLSKSEVGIFSTILNLGYLISSISILGFSTSLPRLISEYQALKEYNKLAAIIRWSLIFILGLNALLTVILILSAVPLGTIISLEAHIIQLAAILSVFILLYSLSAAYLVGLQRMRKLFSTDIINYLVRLAIVIGLVFLDFSYLAPFLALVFSLILVFLLRVYDIPIKSGPVDKKQIWFYSFPATLSTLGATLLFQTGIILLGVFRTFSEVGLFTLAFVIATLFRVIISNISQAIFPITTQQWVRKEEKNLRRLLMHSFRYSYILAIPIISLILFFPKEIIVIFISYEYSEAAFILQLLMMSNLLMGLSNILFNIAYSIRKPNAHRNSMLISGFANIFLGLVLIPTYGTLGATIAFLVSGILMFVIIYFLVKKSFNFSLAISALIKILIISLIYVFLVYIVKTLTSGLPAIIISLSIGLLLYPFLLPFFRFFENEDIFILQTIRSKSPPSLSKIIALYENFIAKRLKRTKA